MKLSSNQLVNILTMWRKAIGNPVVSSLSSTFIHVPDQLFLVCVRCSRMPSLVASWTLVLGSCGQCMPERQNLETWIAFALLCSASSRYQGVELTKRTRTCKCEASSRCLKKASATSPLSGGLWQIRTTMSVMFVCPLTLTCKLWAGSWSTPRQISMHSHCSHITWHVLSWHALLKDPVSIQYSIPAVCAITPHLCDLSKTVALQLHVHLKFLLFVPCLACISLQAVHMGTQWCWFLRKGVRALGILA